MRTLGAARGPANPRTLGGTPKALALSCWDRGLGAQPRGRPALQAALGTQLLNPSLGDMWAGEVVRVSGHLPVVRHTHTSPGVADYLQGSTLPLLDNLGPQGSCPLPARSHRCSTWRGPPDAAFRNVCPVRVTRPLPARLSHVAVEGEGCAVTPAPGLQPGVLQASPLLPPAWGPDRDADEGRKGLRESCASSGVSMGRLLCTCGHCPDLAQTPRTTGS